MLDVKGQGKFLYEAKPSLFPEGELTSTEIALWELYYADKNDRVNVNG